ncbi:MAG: HigA family addiction module antidote protein [Acidobacteria bacterium]|nr:HigA family addiction module antidote protein [Acidobacteriota bacterium]
MARQQALRIPTHPGVILKEELLAPRRLSLNHLARELRVPVNRLSQIVNGKRAITPDTSLRLGRYFGFSPDYWLRLQSRYDFELVRRQHGARIAAEVTPHRAA